MFHFWKKPKRTNKKQTKKVWPEFFGITLIGHGVSYHKSLAYLYNCFCLPKKFLLSFFIFAKHKSPKQNQNKNAKKINKAHTKSKTQIKQCVNGYIKMIADVCGFRK